MFSSPSVYLLTGLQQKKKTQPISTKCGVVNPPLVGLGKIKYIYQTHTLMFRGLIYSGCNLVLTQIKI